MSPEEHAFELHITVTVRRTDRFANDHMSVNEVIDLGSATWEKVGATIAQMSGLGQRIRDAVLAAEPIPYLLPDQTGDQQP